MIIVVDVDDVVADFVPEWLKQHNLKFGSNHTLDDIKTWYWLADLGYDAEKEQESLNLFDNRRFYPNVKPIVGALEGVKALRDAGHMVLFVTASTPGSAGEKYKWLQWWGFLDKEVQSLDYYFEAHNKLAITADLIIDDRDKNVNSYVNNGRMGIIFDRNWNRHLNDPRIPRCLTWVDVINTVKELDAKLEVIKLNKTVTEETPKQKPPVKFDDNKPRWGLLPWEGINEVVKIFTFGAKKYGDYNWAKHNGLSWSRVFDALMRHLFAWYTGEDIDPESKKSHLAHAACGVLFLLFYSVKRDRYGMNDDRPHIAIPKLSGEL